MLWKNRRVSGNILSGGSGRGKVLGAGGLIIGAVIYALMGGNPLDYLAQNATTVQQTGQQSGQPETAAISSDHQKFVGVVLADTEDVWNSIFQQNNMTYREPKLVLFNHLVQSACGRASSAVGPFYCPADQRVYLDLNFFSQLSSRLGAKGDFAEAYVIAHEVGHHVQNLLGVPMSKAGQDNKLSVMIELQADCLAGVWAKQTQDAKQVIEEGDLEEAMGAAAAVGDDRIQQATRGEVVPDSFTHGTSAQRVEAFKLGFQNGDTQKCLQRSI